MTSKLIQITKTLIIDYTQIEYCKGLNNYTEIYIIDGTVKLVSVTLKCIEMILEEVYFVRITKSILINLDRVRYVENRGKKITMYSGEVFLVPRTRTDCLMSFIKYTC